MGERTVCSPNDAGTTEYPSGKIKMNLDTYLIPCTEKLTEMINNLNVRDKLENFWKKTSENIFVVLG